MSKEGGNKVGLYFTIVLIAATLLIVSDNSLTGNAVIGEDYIGDIEGTWDFEERTDESDCRDGKKERTYEAALLQIDDKITLSTKDYTLKGMLIGNNLDLNGIFKRDGGEVDMTYTNIKVSEDCMTFQGKGNWTWEGRGESCEGPVEIVGVRKTGDGCGIAPCEESWECSDWSECVDGQETRLCRDNNKCETKEDIEGSKEEQSCEMPIPAPPEKDYGLTIALIVLILLIITVAYLIVSNSGKKKQLAKQLDSTLEEIYNSLNAGDRVRALDYYKSLTRQFERIKDDLRKKDLNRIYAASIEAFKEINKY
ncbi:hypothetical protein ACFLZZ_03415 [Nanoarchaeota archaeon]